MPRQARMTSATCVYHTILRGVNKQQVFEDEEDYLRFLNVLRRQTQLYVDEQGRTLPRPLQKQYLFSAHEEGIGPRILSRLTGVLYSIVQRATSGTFRSNGMVCEPLPNDEELETYIDCAEYEKYPEY